MLNLKAKPGHCEEAAIGVPFYAPCDKPAVAIVGWKGRPDKPIRMCFACMDHNIRNRGGELIRHMSAEPLSSEHADEREDNRAPPPALRYRVYVDVAIYDLVQLRAAALARATASGMGAAEFEEGAHDEPADNATYWLGWMFDSGTPENCGFEIENSGCDEN